MEFRAVMTQAGDGRWTAALDGDPAVRASGATRERCLAGLRRAVERALPARARREPVTIVVETFPLLVGVAEAVIAGSPPMLYATGPVEVGSSAAPRVSSPSIVSFPAGET